MELVGEEKKITALFSELKLADESIAPQFGVVWNRAQAKTVRSYRAFNLSFVAATALLVCTLGSLAWWSQSWQSAKPQVAAIAPPAAMAEPNRGVQFVKPADKLAATPSRRLNPRPRSLGRVAHPDMGIVATDQTDLLVTREAVAISKWQSPTSSLLGSSNDEIITSLPQLNENANELKSFLPNRPK